MYTVTIHRSSTEAETNRPIYAVDTIDATGHVCDTLSWFSIDSARDYAREMSRRYLDCPIEDRTEERVPCQTCKGTGGVSGHTSDFWGDGDETTVDDCLVCGGKGTIRKGGCFDTEREWIVRR